MRSVLARTRIGTSSQQGARLGDFTNAVTDTTSAVSDILGSAMLRSSVQVRRLETNRDPGIQLPVPGDLECLLNGRSTSSGSPDRGHVTEPHPTRSSVGTGGSLGPLEGAEIRCAKRSFRQRDRPFHQHAALLRPCTQQHHLAGSNGCSQRSVTKTRVSRLVPGRRLLICVPSMDGSLCRPHHLDTGQFFARWRYEKVRPRRDAQSRHGI